VSIFEAAAGGLFIPLEAGVRPGNFVTLPNQRVDTQGNITVPYAGSIRASGRTPAEVQQAIVSALKNRAIEPQAVVALLEQRTSLISVLGDVNAAARFPANAEPERVLDAITRAGGPKSQGFDEWVMLERQGRRATAPFGALVYEPSNNVYVYPNDTIYLYREPQTFVAFGAFGGLGGGAAQGLYNFDAWRLSLAEAVAKSGGLSDAVADPASVFLYRGETREIAELFGVDCTPFPGPIIPVVYVVNFHDPSGYFLATKMQMRNKDVLYISNAQSVETAKLMTYFRLVIATVNDPILAATNAINLQKLIVGTATSSTVIQQSPAIITTAPSDIRLKRDIVLLDRLPNGIGLYRYRYVWSEQVYVGVMAQEVARIVPDAVERGADGFLRVNYARLGMRLLTWEEWSAKSRRESTMAGTGSTFSLATYELLRSGPFAIQGDDNRIASHYDR
jgi:polysaccharide export outer membrane protein